MSARYDRWTVALAQFSPVLGDVPANLERHLQLIAQMRASGAQLGVFPELSLTGYYLRDLVGEVALPADAPPLQRLAQESKDLALVVGFVEEAADFRFYNTAAYFEGGALRHLHRKVYLPTYGMFDEERYFDAGERIAAFDTRFGRMALLICEDLWHPSAPYLASQDGATTLIAIANSPGRGIGERNLDTAQDYESLIHAYSRFFQMYCLFANRSGWEEGVTFWGGSAVADPFGRMAARAPCLQEHLLVANIDPMEVRRARLSASLVGDERLDLTIRELERIRRERAGD